MRVSDIRDQIMPSLDAEPLLIAVDDAILVSGLLLMPQAARACVVLAHGAGTVMNQPFMAATAKGLAQNGIATRAASARIRRNARRQPSAPPWPKPPHAYATSRSLPAAHRLLVA
jgi:hypothetical protein